MVFCCSLLVLAGCSLSGWEHSWLYLQTAHVLHFLDSCQKQFLFSLFCSRQAVCLFARSSGDRRVKMVVCLFVYLFDSLFVCSQRAVVTRRVKMVPNFTEIIQLSQLVGPQTNFRVSWLPNALDLLFLFVFCSVSGFFFLPGWGHPTGVKQRVLVLV